MTNHAVRERLASADLCSQMKGVEGVDSVMLTRGEKLNIDLDRTPALSPFAYSEVGVWQRLRAIITYPDLDRPSYALVEVLNGNNQRRLLLAALSDGQEPARFVRILDEKRAVANGPTWQSTMLVDPSERFVFLEHGGAGATEIIGAKTQDFQVEGGDLIPAETWAPPASEVLYKCFPPAGQAT